MQPGPDFVQALGDPRTFGLAIVELPGEAARSLVAALRRDRRFDRFPLLVAPAAATPVDVYEAFEAGATDVLPLPMNGREFALRVCAHLRRAARARGIRRIDLGGRVLDFDAHQIFEGDRRIEPLTPRETAILEHLVKRPGRPATTEEILVEALGYPPRRGNPEIVRTHVRHLREKIEPDPRRPRFLVNVPRVGYRLDLGEAHLVAAASN
jgi:DNA-binding response OmpR family regulator